MLELDLPPRVLVKIGALTTFSRAEERLLEDIEVPVPVPPPGARDRRIKPRTHKGGVIRAELLRCLLLSPSIVRCIGFRGLRIPDAVITGEMDLSFLELDFPITFVRCFFRKRILLYHARLAHLAFRGGCVREIHANGCTINGDLVLNDGVCVNGPVRLRNALVRGTVECSTARFLAEGGVALHGKGLRVSGDVRLTGVPATSTSPARPFKALGRIRLEKAQIRGHLRCEHALLDNRRGRPLAERSVEAALTLDSARLGGVSLRHMTVHGGLALHGTHLAGELRLRNARLLALAGDLKRNADAAPSVLPRAGAAIDGDLLRAHAVTLTESTLLFGETSLQTATVAGALVVDRCRLVNGGRNALKADLARLGTVTFEKSEVSGEVRLLRAEVRGNLQMKGTVVRNPAGDAVSLDNARVAGSVHLSAGFQAVGTVRLVGVSVGRNLDFRGGTLVAAPESPALNAPRARIGGDVLLSKFPDPQAQTPQPGGKKARGRRFSATGHLLLSGARVAGKVTIDEADLVVRSIHNTAKGTTEVPPALAAQSLLVQGLVEVRDSACNSTLDFTGSRIEADLLVCKLRLDPAHPTGLVTTSAFVGAHLSWTDTPARDGTHFNFAHATVGRLTHPRGSWPKAQGKLTVNGLRYSALDVGRLNGPGKVPSSRRRRLRRVVLRALAWASGSPRRTKLAPLDWLALQAPDDFDPQPYEQCSCILRQSGHDDAADTVEVAMHETRRATGGLSAGAKLRNWLLGVTLQHGHSTHRVLLGGLCTLVLGSLLFWQGDDARLMAPTREDVYMAPAYAGPGREPAAYPRFDAVAYSVDAFFPVLDLHQEEYWLPNRNARCTIDRRSWPCGRWLRYYLWFQITVGWVVTTLAVVSFTGLVRNRSSA